MRELPNVDGDARKVGYYTGIIVRLIFLKEQIWTKLRDTVGVTPLRG